MNYYNEIDEHACQWLKNLMDDGLIPKGYIDNRSIEDVKGVDLEGYTQCHFFAGISGWPRALELAGWSSNEPIWTGSCPCQSLSVAGLGKGAKDERHLWPEFARLIFECRPSTVFGEQVASKLGRAWLTGVRLDLEEMGFGFWGTDIGAASIGAPHIRQRLFWVAYFERHGLYKKKRSATIAGSNEQEGELSRGSAGRMENTEPIGRRGRGNENNTGQDGAVQIEGSSADCRVGNTMQSRGQTVSTEQAGIEPSNHWTDSIYIPCGDGKARRIKSGLEPLVDGIPFELVDGRTVKGASRVKLLKGIGNAIVPPLAAEFIRAYMEIADEQGVRNDTD